CRSGALSRGELLELPRDDGTQRERNTKSRRLAEAVLRRADEAVSRGQATCDAHAADRQGLFGSADRSAGRLLRSPAHSMSDTVRDRTMNRRELLKVGAAGALVSSLSGCASMGSRRTLGKVVVIGAGYGGATAAKYLRLWSAGAIEVT